MGGLGFAELVVICVIALLVFGPKKLPDAGRALGQAIRGFKASMDGKEETQTGTKAIQTHPSCLGCGKSIESEMAFCAHCGRALGAVTNGRAANA